MPLPNSNQNNHNVAIDPEQNRIAAGFGYDALSQMRKKHPLEQSELTYNCRLDEMHFSVLRKTQGLAAPFKLSMERQAAAKIGRHPFLPSSNLMLEVLEGRDGVIGFEDLFHDRLMHPEVAARPHVAMERKFGLFK